MPTRRLTTHRFEKPWGRQTLWPGFENAAPGADPVGEIWFVDETRDAELLVKYMFTGARLSIQVHPDDTAAYAAGLARGKDEAWVILDAAGDSVIGLGTHNELSADALRAAAVDGSIEQHVDWKRVKTGDVFYSPAGTIHAIGAGITLIEVQQNIDVTYRLYDYGRPRELHLDAGISVANARPFVADFTPVTLGGGRTIIAEGPKFIIERWAIDGARTVTLPEGLTGYFIPVSGSGAIGGEGWRAGECWAIEGEARITADAGNAADLLFTYPLGERLGHDLLR